MFHISALDRWGRAVKHGWIGRDYAPPNLRLVLDRIYRTYEPARDAGDKTQETKKEPFDPLYVVGWCGNRLEATDQNCPVWKIRDPVLNPKSLGQPAQGKADRCQA
jgi:hypothetical protein